MTQSNNATDRNDFLSVKTSQTCVIHQYQSFLSPRHEEEKSHKVITSVFVLWTSAIHHKNRTWYYLITCCAFIFVMLQQDVEPKRAWFTIYTSESQTTVATTRTGSTLISIPSFICLIGNEENKNLDMTLDHKTSHRVNFSKLRFIHHLKAE